MKIFFSFFGTFEELLTKGMKNILKMKKRMICNNREKKIIFYKKLSYRIAKKREQFFL